MPTKHTCRDGRGPVFGYRTAGCPRCDELSAGAKPVQWGPGRARIDQERCAEVRAHFQSTKHTSGACGPVCTFGGH